MVNFMDNITLIKKIRRSTGLGVLTCKKALNKYKGNIELAINYLLTAHKLKSRNVFQNEGRITIKVSRKMVLLVQINCETDFVSNDITFKRFVNKVANKVLYTKQTTIKNLFHNRLDIDLTVLINKLKENVILRNILLINIQRYTNNTIAYYTHKNRIGSLVIINNCDLQVAKDIAMQIIATNPYFIYIKDITNNVIKKELSYIISITNNTPLTIVNKIIKNKLQKYFTETSLVNQLFIRDKTLTVSTLLSLHTNILYFYRFEFN